MYCVYCNHPLKGDEKECPSCGRPVGTFVQIEAFRNGKGQKAAAAALDDLALPENPEDISAKIVSMGKEIKALRKENESLKKEQTELRALIDEGRTTPGNGQPLDNGKGGPARGGFLSALLTAAIAALIPLVALVVIYTGLSKKNADLEKDLYEATDRIDQRIDSVQADITDISENLENLKKDENTGNSIAEENVTEDPAKESEKITEEPVGVTPKESSGEESAGDTSEKSYEEESAGDTSEKSYRRPARDTSDTTSGKTPADTYAGNPDENTEQYAPFYPSGYPAGI